MLKRKPYIGLTCTGCLSQVCYESDLSLNPLSIAREEHMQGAAFCHNSHRDSLEQIRRLRIELEEAKTDLERITEVLIRQETRYLTKYPYI